MPTTSKAPISHHALMQRVNRVLRAKGQEIRKPKGVTREALGEYFIIDTEQGRVVRANVDLASEALRLGVLQSWEEAAAD